MEKETDLHSSSEVSRLLAAASSGDDGREEICAGRDESAGMRRRADEDEDNSTVQTRTAAKIRWATSLRIIVDSLTAGPWWSIIDPGDRNSISPRWISCRWRPNVLHRTQAILSRVASARLLLLQGWDERSMGSRVYSGSISSIDKILFVNCDAKI